MKREKILQVLKNRGYDILYPEQHGIPTQEEIDNMSALEEFKLAKNLEARFPENDPFD